VSHDTWVLVGDALTTGPPRPRESC
jgi:hypothetical protein